MPKESRNAENITINELLEINFTKLEGRKIAVIVAKPDKGARDECESLDALEVLVKCCKENFIPFKEFMRNHYCQRCGKSNPAYNRTDRLLIPTRHLREFSQMLCRILQTPELSLAEENFEEENALTVH